MCPRGGRCEILQKYSDPPLMACPTWGKEVHGRLSAPAIQFKGTGWYITDYARKSSGGDGADGSSSSTSKEAKEAKSTEAKGSKDTSSSSPASTTSKDGSASGSSPSK